MAKTKKECDPLKVNFRDKKTEALQDEISSLRTQTIGRAMSRTQEYRFLCSLDNGVSFP